MSKAQIIRGPILQPKLDGSVAFIRDGALAGDSSGRIEYVGDWSTFPGRARKDVRAAHGVICPPFFDNHIHIPQHPIRGHFMDGVSADPEHGGLIEGLNRNVFPAEARCADRAYTEACVAEFLRDTLANGVVGGAAYMTVHPAAARIALERLPRSWSAGLVMMNQNCPDYLRNDESSFDRDAEALARDFGSRYIVTDRFAVACDAALRKRGVAIAKQFGLRMQTHLNEQIREKQFVEQVLYPGYDYTGVYERDGLLDRPGAIMAHCIHMTERELDALTRRACVIAHCPVSNTLLGSGIMSLDRIIERGIDYAICTDVGASPTTSLLNEIAQYLKVHARRSKQATPSEALFRITLGAARMMNLHDRFGQLEVGRPMSFVEIDCAQVEMRSADDVIRNGILEGASEPSAELLEALATGNADKAQVAALAQNVHETVEKLQNKVRGGMIDSAPMLSATSAS